MTAFDGRSEKVSVFFDSDGEEINIALSDEVEDGVQTLTPDEAAQLVQDLMMAIWVRGEACIYVDLLEDLRLG